MRDLTHSERLFTISDQEEPELKCPFCAEQISDEAIKCKHCGSILDPQKVARLKDGMDTSTRMTPVANDTSAAVKVDIGKPSAIAKYGGGFIVVCLVLGVIPTIFGKKNKIATESQIQNSGSNLPIESTTSARSLYRYWQARNKPEPGSYEDEMVGGEVLHTCQVDGKYRAEFGYLMIRTTVLIVATPNSRPTPVFVGGVDYGGEKLRTLTAPPETGGQGVLDYLASHGCPISEGLRTRAKAAVAGKFVEEQ